MQLERAEKQKSIHNEMKVRNSQFYSIINIMTRARPNHNEEVASIQALPQRTCTCMQRLLQRPQLPSRNHCNLLCTETVRILIPLIIVHRCQNSSQLERRAPLCKHLNILAKLNSRIARFDPPKLPLKNSNKDQNQPLYSQILSKGLQGPDFWAKSSTPAMRKNTKSINTFEKAPFGFFSPTNGGVSSPILQFTNMPNTTKNVIPPPLFQEFQHTPSNLQKVVFAPKLTFLFPNKFYREQAHASRKLF